MLLVVNIGNSVTVLGLRAEDGTIVHRWRIRTDPRCTPDEFGATLRTILATRPGEAEVGAAMIASVVPPLTGIVLEAIETYLDVPAHPFRFDPALGIRLDVDVPSEVGADRVANTLAAHLAYPGPAIVVDLGTATNFDVVSEEGAFLGGIIAPGIEMQAASLPAKTALLPRVAVEFPPTYIGRSTAANMQIGVYLGATVLIDGFVGRIRDEWIADARVIATGGLAGPIARRCSTVDVVDPDLTLRGVGWGYERLVPRTT